MNTEIKDEKLIIIGGGPAGLTSAIYAIRAGLNPLVLMGPEPGGQITTTPWLENFPGFPEGISGPDLMQKVIQQAGNLGVRLIYEMVNSVDFSKRPYMINTADITYQAKTVIVATGASHRRLGLKNEGKLAGRGISYCATCDGAFFRDKNVAIVGGGDVALEEANYLTRFASKVYIIHRRNQFRGTKILADRVKENPKIEIVWDSIVKEIQGEKKLNGLLLENKKTNEKRKLGVEGFFIAIGHIPNSALFKGQLELDEKAYIITDDNYMTNKEGIFAAGDVRDSRYRQVVTAAGVGAMAAIEVERLIDS
ncbi:MAG TPA: thioredoxin-disulfide reductase [Halanaerobiales bacterium]|nr:thioredoxin-disulfide reductase [Halanaerobiales bacterium]